MRQAVKFFHSTPNRLAEQSVKKSQSKKKCTNNNQVKIGKSSEYAVCTFFLPLSPYQQFKWVLKYFTYLVCSYFQQFFLCARLPLIEKQHCSRVGKFSWQETDKQRRKGQKELALPTGFPFHT